MKIYNLKYIQTPRLLIRPIQLGDEIELNAAIQRSLPAIQRWMPWARNANSETTNEFVQHAVAGWQSRKAVEFPMVVIFRETNKIIAASGFNEYSIPAIPFYEIGYWLDVDSQGKGLATELVNALTRYAFVALNAQRLQIRTQIDNEKSIAVAKRCGYTLELQLKHDRLDCASGQVSDGLLFACCDIAALPPLDVSWEHVECDHNQLISSLPIKSSPSPEKLLPLQTKRLKLIPPRESDSIFIHNALMASMNEIAPWFSWAKPNLTVEQVSENHKEDIIAAKDIKAHIGLFYCVWEKETFLGEVWLEIRDWSVMSAEIGYWFDSRKTGKGFATEAVDRLIQYAFEALGASRISIIVSEQNHRSLNLVKRLDMQNALSYKMVLSHRLITKL